MNRDTQTGGQDPIQDPITPLATDPTAPAETAATSGQRDPEPAHRKTAPQPRSRTSPIVWGALILAFCGYVAQRTLRPGELDTTVWITATVIGLGLLLLGVGASVLIRNRRR